MKYLLLFSLLFILSCSPEKKLNKLQLNHPEIVAKKTSEWYPCLPVSHTIDSSLYKKWISSIDSLNKLYSEYKPDSVVIIDSIIKIDSSKCIKCLKDNGILINRIQKANELIKDLNNKILNAPIIRDTIIKIDSANSKVLSSMVARLTDEANKSQKKQSNLFWFCIWLLIALGISIVLNVIQLKK